MQYQGTFPGRVDSDHWDYFLPQRSDVPLAYPVPIYQLPLEYSEEMEIQDGMRDSHFNPAFPLELFNMGL